MKEKIAYSSRKLKHSGVTHTCFTYDGLQKVKQKKEDEIIDYAIMFVFDGDTICLKLKVMKTIT